MPISGPEPTASTEALLERAEANLAARRRADAEELAIARQWALAHRRTGDAVDQRTDAREIGAARLRIWEFAPAELAMAWEVHPLAAQRLMADAIDLHDRLPHAWRSVRDGRLAAWVARKLVRLTHDLPPDQARDVDVQLSEEYAVLSPGRLLTIAEGRVTAADPGAADERATKARREHLVHISRPVDNSATIFARCSAVDAARLLQTCDDIAHLLDAANGDQERETLDQLRARALGILADPRAALDLLSGRDPRHGRAVVYVHLTPDLLERRGGVARVEEIGPWTRRMLADVLGHDRITLKPVIDLAEDSPVDCYEVPSGLAERVQLLKPADIFPWAGAVGRSVDLDHTVPWPQGPTSLENLAKMTRRHHRIKTHARGWSVQRLSDHCYLWRSPHGRYAVVDRHGTHRVRTRLQSRLAA